MSVQLPREIYDSANWKFAITLPFEGESEAVAGAEYAIDHTGRGKPGLIRLRVQEPVRSRQSIQATRPVPITARTLAH